MILVDLGQVCGVMSLCALLHLTDEGLLARPELKMNGNPISEISGRTKDYGLDTSIRTGEDLRGETVVEGSVAGGTDSFLYSGDVSDLTTDAELEVYINGELVNYDEFERDIITIDGSEVTGSVVRGRDSYAYTGEI